MTTAQKAHQTFTRIGAACCAAALTAGMFGCCQKDAPSQAPPSPIASSETEQPPTPFIPSGLEMEEEEIFRLASDLIAQAQSLEDRAADASLWDLDTTDSFAEEQYGMDVVFYRLLSVQDRAQLRQILSQVFSSNYANERIQSLFRPDSIASFRERDGKLYVSKELLSREPSYFLYTGNFVLIGRTEDTISLQAELSFDSGSGQIFENWPLTLRREDSRWTLDGWKTEMRADNSFVQLPDDLEQLAREMPELSASLRYAWVLGDSLSRGDQRWTDWCFSGLFEPPVSYQELGYPLQDITGLKVSDFAVEADANGAVYLMLDVDDPGTTPLRTGSNWYLLTFGRDIDRVNGVIQKMYPDSEQAAFGLGKDAEKDEETAKLNHQLTAAADLFFSWACSDVTDKDWWKSDEYDVPLEVPYVAVRMAYDEPLVTSWHFTAEEFEQAARDYLDEPDYKVDPDRLRLRCDEENGLFSLRAMGASLADIDRVCRTLGGGIAGGKAPWSAAITKTSWVLFPTTTSSTRCSVRWAAPVIGAYTAAANSPLDLKAFNKLS